MNQLVVLYYNTIGIGNINTRFSRTNNCTKSQVGDYGLV